MKLDGIEVFGIAAKAAGAGVLAALHLSLPVLVGSVIGAGFSFHFDRENRPKTFLGAVYAMGAMATAGVVATYVVPRIDVQLSASFQFKPGTLGLGGNDSASNGNSVNANYVVTNAIAGIPLLNNQQSVNLLQPGDLYGDYVRQVDMRIGKILRFGRTRTLVGVDIYNLFNANPGLTYQQTFVGAGQTWYNPTTLLMPRFVRFNITTDF